LDAFAVGVKLLAVLPVNSKRLKRRASMWNTTVYSGLLGKVLFCCLVLSFFLPFLFSPEVRPTFFQLGFIPIFVVLFVYMASPQVLWSIAYLANGEYITAAWCAGVSFFLLGIAFFGAKGISL
jgi:hypothetical protein